MSSRRLPKLPPASPQTQIDATRDLTPARAVLLLGAMFAVSALLRFLGREPLATPSIFGDELWHVEFGRSVLDGRGMRWGDSAAQHPSWLYPLLIAPLFDWLPRREVLKGIAAVNALCISLALPLAYGLARRYVTRRRALAVAGLTALLTTMSYAAHVMAENVFFPMSLAAFWLMLRALENPTLGRRLCAGAMMGLMYHAKPQGLFFPIIFAVAVGLETLFLFPAWRDRILRLLAHWLTAAAWFVFCVGPRWIEAAFYERTPRPFWVDGFLGNYTGRAIGDLPFSFSAFMAMLGGNFAVLAFACGFVPFFYFVVAAPRALRSAAPPAVRQLVVLILAVTIVVTFASARHTVIADPVHSIYERYLMIVFPLLFCLLAWAPFPWPASRATTLGSWAGVLVVAAILTVAAIQMRWLLAGNLPSLSAFYLFAHKSRYGWIPPAGLLTLAALLACLVGREFRRRGWTVPVRAMTAAALIVLMNYGLYVSVQAVLKPWMRKNRQLAEAIEHAVPEGDRLLIIMDALTDQAYWQIATRVPSIPVTFGSRGAWNIRPLRVSATGVPLPPGDLNDFWLLTNARWPVSGEPEEKLGNYNLFDLAVYPPPRIDMQGVREQLALQSGDAAAANDGFPDQFEITWVSVVLPRRWKAGDTSTVRVTIRNDSPFTLRPGEGRWGIGYHWGNFELTGSWKAVVWDDGNYTWLPDELDPGQTASLNVRVKIPEMAGGGWTLTLSPLQLGETNRLWGDALRSKIFADLEVVP